MFITEQRLIESSLARLWKHTQAHDYGTITAFRDAKECGEGEKYTKSENFQRNAALLVKLQAKRYSVTKIKGSYIENYGSENAVEVQENSFIVIDINDRGDLESTILQLGKEFEQDSVIFGEAGQSGSLIGTSHCPNAYPGYGITNRQGGAIFGKDGEFMSRVNGRPFVFAESAGINVMDSVRSPTKLRSLTELAKRRWDEFPK